MTTKTAHIDISKHPYGTPKKLTWSVVRTAITLSVASLGFSVAILMGGTELPPEEYHDTILLAFVTDLFLHTVLCGLIFAEAYSAIKKSEWNGKFAAAQDAGERDK